MKTITVKSGIGREVNPVIPPIIEPTGNAMLDKIQSEGLASDMLQYREEYDAFERTVQSYPCFSTTGEPVEDYQGEAELGWQKFYMEKWTNASESDYRGYKDFSNYAGFFATQQFLRTRQVWIVSEPTKSFGREPVGYDTTDYSSPHAPLLNGGDGEEPKCVMGCKHFYGGEIKHHVDCPFYPDSLSIRLDECESAIQSASKEPLEVGEETNKSICDTIDAVKNKIEELRPFFKRSDTYDDVMREINNLDPRINNPL